jgi:hypothetical protein
VDPLLTDNEFAGVIQRPPWWVKKQRNRGWGPAYIRIGRSIRYRREDVEKWLESQLEGGSEPRLHPNAEPRSAA